MVYSVTLARQSHFYLRFVLLPLAIFSLISFSVFFMSFEVGERLGFGITLVLVVEVAKQTISTFLPVCGELVWMELYIWINWIFTCLALLESCLVLGLAYNTEEFFVDLLTPAWFRPLRSFLYGSWLRQRVRWLDAALMRVGIVLPAPTKKEDAPQEEQESAAAKHVRQKGLTHEPPTGDDSRTSRSGRNSGREHETLAPEEDDAQKLLYFESLFFKMDPDGDGSITFEEAGRLLAFTMLGVTADERHRRLAAADDGDGELTRQEFIGLCVDNLWDTPRSTLEMAAENFADFSRMKDNRISAKWRRVANNIDRFCRAWVPLLYLTASAWTRIEPNPLTPV